MRSGRLWFGMAVATTLLLVVTACGSGQPTGAGQPAAKGQPAATPAPSATPATPATPAPAKAAAPAAPKPEKTNITISTPTTDIVFLPIFVGADRGIYKAEGLDVRVVTFQGARENTQALMSGASDLSSSAYDDVVSAVVAKQTVRSFWGQSNNPTFQWWARAEIKTMADAAKKRARFAVSKSGALSDHLTRWAIQKAGFNPDKDAQIVGVGGPAERWAALKSGQVDVGILTAPGYFTAERAGMTKLLSQADFMKDGFSLEVWMAKTEILDKNPGTIIALLRGTNKAVDWIQANLDAAAKVVCDRSGQCDKDDVIRTIKENIPYWPKDGRFSEEGEKFMLGVLAEAGNAPANAASNLDQFRDYRFQKALKENPQWFR